MTKKEFIKKIINMENPVMIFGSSDSDLLNDWCVVKDEHDRSMNFAAFHCRLSKNEYARGDVNNYLNRSDSMKKKFENWMYDVCGNYCRVINLKNI